MNIEIEKLDSVDPEEDVGVFGGSGQWISIATVQEMRLLLPAPERIVDLVEALQATVDNIQGVADGTDIPSTVIRKNARDAVIRAKQFLSAAADDDEPLSTRDLAMIDQAWENHKTALPVATVINDNQPGRTAIMEITIDPPTLPVGTKLYAGPKMVELAAETSPGDVLAIRAVGNVRALIADLQGEHEVMCGPFDASKWKIEVPVSDLQILLAAIDRLDVKAEAKSQEPEAVAINGRPYGTDVIDRLSERKLNCRQLSRYIWDRAHNEPDCFEQDIARLIQNERREAVKRATAHPTTKPEAPAVGVDAIKAALCCPDGCCEPKACGAGKHPDEIAQATAIAALIAGGR